MNRPGLAAAIVSVLATLALAAPAGAHNVYVAPRYAEIPDTFYFRGVAWQPYQRVYWFYDEYNDRSYDQRGSFFPNRFGRWTWDWLMEGQVYGTHRLCFRQYDSRYRFRRTFFKCQWFVTLGPD
jgi:hypothetical protein